MGGFYAVACTDLLQGILMFGTLVILPIAGFNYGAKKFARVKEVIRVSFKYATILAVVFTCSSVAVPSRMVILIPTKEI